MRSPQNMLARHCTVCASQRLGFYLLTCLCIQFEKSQWSHHTYILSDACFSQEYSLWSQHLRIESVTLPVSFPLRRTIALKGSLANYEGAIVVGGKDFFKHIRRQRKLDILTLQVYRHDNCGQSLVSTLHAWWPGSSPSALSIWIVWSSKAVSSQICLTSKSQSQSLIHAGMLSAMPLFPLFVSPDYGPHERWCTCCWGAFLHMTLYHQRPWCWNSLVCREFAMWNCGISTQRHSGEIL